MSKFFVRLILLGVAGSTCIVYGLTRRGRWAGDRAPPGKCVVFQWGGAKKLFHHYACCNNCADSDRSCDGRTYQSVVTNRYCRNCGADSQNGNALIKGRAFACGGCSNQNFVEAKCKSGLRAIYKIPGLCWAFTACFKWHCWKNRSERIEKRSLDQCFNLVCDPGETVENCPIDCCSTVQKECDWNLYGGKGIAECCSTPTCCRKDEQIPFNRNKTRFTEH